MSEKLCLKWNDFQVTVKNAFGSFRESRDFADVTLACEDGYQIEAHKVVLAASSPMLQDILRRNKHSYPLIYMRGVKSDDLASILDFLYFGEANVNEENLDTFLALAQELQLKGLKASKDDNGHREEHSQAQSPFEQNYKTPQVLSSKGAKPMTSTVAKRATELANFIETKNHAVAIPKTELVQKTELSTGDLQILDTVVKSMMETSENSFTIHGKHGDRQERGKICKACGKEGRPHVIRDHIEANHLEGVAIPCNLCDKTVRCRHPLDIHVRKHHLIKVCFSGQEMP